MEQQLIIEVIPTGRAVTFVLQGELDASSVGTLRACLDDLDGQWRSVVLDMTGVTFIDSTGISLLIQANRNVAMDFRHLELRNVSEPVRRVLELSGASELTPTATAL